MTTTEIGGTTKNFAEGKRLSEDLRATTGEQMQALVQRLEYLKKNARDYIVPAKHIRATAKGVVKIEFPMTLAGTTAVLAFELGKLSHEDFGTKLGIPAPYYRRMQTDAPELLVTNIQHWLDSDGRSFLIRTLDENVRAVLSDRFRILDSYDYFLHVTQTGREMGAAIQRLDLSEERIYVRMLMPDFAAKIYGRADDLRAKGKMFSSGYRNDNGRWQGPDDDDPDGDWVFAAIVGSNSDVGRGGLTVESAAFATTCINYIIVGKALHKVHLGERRESGMAIASDTQAAKDKALWLEARDTVRSTFDEETFKQMVRVMNDAQATEIVEPVQAIDTVVAAYDMSDEDKQSILNELISPSVGVKRGNTVWGLVNAVTAVAREKSVEDGVKLERIGAELLEKLPAMVEVRRPTD